MPGTETQLAANRQGHSNQHFEKPASGPVQKERRKFQEFPVAAKPVGRDIAQVWIISILIKICELNDIVIYPSVDMVA